MGRASSPGQVGPGKAMSPGPRTVSTERSPRAGPASLAYRSPELFPGSKLLGLGVDR